MNHYLIAPSLLSANFAYLGDEARAVLTAGGDLLHLDVMDNHYVPNLTLGPMFCEALRNDGIDAHIDIHLMASPVDPLIIEFAKAGANTISFHPEASLHVHRSIELIRQHGCKPGLAINPGTSLDCLDWTLEQLDFVLIMSVNPGFGGQKFIPESLKKIQAVRQRINAQNKPIHLAVDGGVHQDNIRAIAEAGANLFVSGSGIFKTPNYAEAINKMRHELAQVNKT